MPNAKNINWNDDKFEENISQLNKSTPVFVYCLSGGRSASAAARMRSIGFTTVYELNGGIIKWRSAGFPETTTTQKTGITKSQFEALIDTQKLVLIDFYAPWCAPCKEMAPYLEEISKEMADKVTIIRINADENKFLCAEMKVEALPTLLLYKNKNLVWSNTGYISKQDVVKHLE